jgi:hypothetical protein
LPVQVVQKGQILFLGKLPVIPLSYFGNHREI